MSGRLYLLAGFPCLAGLAFSYLLVARAQERQRRAAQRLASVLGRDQQAALPGAVSVRTSRTSAPRRSVAARLAGFLGADFARTELYHLPWWLVPVAALPPATVVILLGRFLLGAGVWAALPFVCWMLCRRYFAGRHQQRIATLLGQLPDALATIVRAVRVGIPISESIRVVAAEAAEPTRGEFARLADEVAIGAPLDEALRALADRNGVPEYRFFATALSLQAQTGGAISETLDNLADVIRKRVAARARGKALAAEARTSALVLSVLPVVALAGLWLMNHAYIDVLFQTEAGHTILAGAALLLGLGTFAMRGMIRMSLS